MPLQSDMTLDASKFSSHAISDETNKFNEQLIDLMKGGPRWWEVGAAKYRQMRWNGETPLPKAVILDSGKNIKIPSRESGREIQCRVFKPESTRSKGVFYHIHGGGWVLQSEEQQDPLLKYFADHLEMTVVSVGYRLAPEHPYPAGNEDCFDVGEYLIDNAEKEFGVPLIFMGGESAGGHLSVVTCYHLLESRPNFAFKGLVLSYGAYDLSGFLPQAHHFKLPLVLDVQIMTEFISLPILHRKAYLPNTTDADRRDYRISPLFADLSRMKLPPAFFLCGSLDCLLDDSVFLHSKWAMSGAESILKIYPGAPHGFTLFPPSSDAQVQKALQDIVTFVKDRS